MKPIKFFHQILIFFKKLPRRLAENAFLTCLLFFVLALLFGGIIFYKYSYLPEKVEQKITGKPIQFKEKEYQEILRSWEIHQEIFNKTELKIYNNPFGASLQP